MQKKAKTVPKIEEPKFEADFVALYDNTMYIKKQHNTLKFIAEMIILEFQKSSFITIFSIGIETTAIAVM